jgi:histidine triad (HIT) family protein
MKQGCIFCNIAHGIMESVTLFENLEFRVILDKFPAAKGHVLILPKEHIEDIYELDAETAGKIFALATIVAKAMREVLDCEGLNVLQNNGEVAGQTVHHFHLHLIPRFEQDHINISWPIQELSDDDLETIGQAISKQI